MIFLLDSSRYVDRYNWLILLKFVQTTMAEIGRYGLYCSTKTAVVAFSSEAMRHVGLGCHSASGRVLNDVMRIPWMNEGRNLASALQMAREIAQNRDTCRKVALLITNTSSDRNRSATSREAGLTRAVGVQPYILSLGNEFSHAEAYDITRDEKHMMSLNEYRMLLVATTMEAIRKWLYNPVSGEHGNKHSVIVRPLLY